VGLDIWTISLGRDPFSMGSHLLGALLSLVATYMLVRRARRHGMKGIGAGTYGLLMTLAFSASALFHYVDGSSPRYELYNKLDHVAIFLMIAGTGTAIYAALQTWWTTYFTGALWGCAVSGILLKLTFWSMPPWLTAGVYLLVGWLGSLGVVALGRLGEGRPVRLFLLGGLAFSVGAVVYAVGWPVLWRGVIGAHEVFHVFVLLGAALHFDFVYRHCTHRVLPTSATSNDAHHPSQQTASPLS
jgi:hemolysin III